MRLASFRCLFCCLLPLALVLATPAVGEVIHQQRSLYRDITVEQNGPRRCLIFNVHRGDRNQTCIDLDDPDRLVFSYTRMSLAGLLLTPEPESVLVAGLGGGSIPLAFSDLFPEALIDVVEIDPAVVSVAKEFFLFEETANLRVHVNEAAVFVKRAGREGRQDDYIVLDAFTGDYIPEHLLTREFLEEVKRILSPDGVLVANTFSSSRLYDHESVTYQRVWNEFYNFRMPSSGNRLIVTRHDALPARGELVRAARGLAGRLEKYGIRLLEYPARMSTRVDWDMSRRVLTDQFSPGNLLRD